MATGPRGRPDRTSLRRGRQRLALGVAAALAIIVVALISIALLWSGASLSTDTTALASIKLAPFAGTLVSVRAVDATGTPIPLSIDHGRLTPLRKVRPGEAIAVEVVIDRPGWQSWALGDHRTVTLTLHAPTAQVTSRWLTVASGSPVDASFDRPVSMVSYRFAGQPTHLLTPPTPRRTVSLDTHTSAGTVEVATAPRRWERLSAPTVLTWFPSSHAPVMVSDPAAGSSVAPTQPIRLTFSTTVASALGSTRPTISPHTSGSWRQIDSHTLVFTPIGVGPPLGSRLDIHLPRSVAVADSAGTITGISDAISLTIPLGSTLRLDQLLAQQGYLPVDWTPTGTAVASTTAAQTEAAVAPPAGSFSWRYPDTPSSLQALWTPGRPNEITRGAVMMFEHEADLTVDGIAGPEVWRTIIADAVAGRRHEGGYTYVYVHREASPETLTLWHDGHTVLTSPANTGIEGAETELGTFPVFEHIPEGTMEGTNPDGSHYDDPGIKWISYFNGGDAIHNFDRASFGSRQSLGCVELPLEAAAEVWPYTPIGTLVTIEP